MKIKLDENLPLRLATPLRNLGHDVHTLHDEMLLGHADIEILGSGTDGIEIPDYPRLGFLGLATFAPGSHYGILLLRLRSPNRRDLIERVGQLFQKENVKTPTLPNGWKSRPPDDREFLSAKNTRKDAPPASPSTSVTREPDKVISTFQRSSEIRSPVRRDEPPN
jgi:hypothetical protein